jgi:hypothetical protein
MLQVSTEKSKEMLQLFLEKNAKTARNVHNISKDIDGFVPAGV